MIYIIKALLLSVVWTFVSVIYMINNDKPVNNKNQLIVFGPTLITLLIMVITFIVML
jgi:hypothetical protein